MTYNPDEDVCLRICDAYGGNPEEPEWHSVEGIASILNDLTSTALAHARSAAIAQTRRRNAEKPDDV